MPTLIPQIDPTLLNGNVGNNQFEPYAGITQSDVAVVFIDFTLGNVVVQVINASGQTLSTTIANDATGATRRLPSIEPKPGGGFWVTWQEDSGGVTKIYSRNFGPAGTPLEAPFVVDVLDSTNSDFGPNAAVSENGNIFYVWDEIINPFNIDVRGRLFNENGSPAGLPSTVNGTTTGNQTNSMVTALPDGTYVVVFASYDGNDRRLIGLFLGADGVPEGLPFTIESNGIDLVIVDPAIEITDDGFAVAYKKVGPNNTTIIAVKHYDLDGVQIGAIDIVDPNPANINNGSISLIAFNSQTLIASWISTNQTAAPDPLVAVALDLSNGLTPYSAPVVIADNARFMLNGSSVELPNGGLFFSWDGPGTGDSQGIFYRIFSLQNAADVGDAVQASATPEGDERGVSLAAFGDGFVAGWNEGETVVFRQWASDLTSIADVKTIGTGSNSVVIELGEFDVGFGGDFAGQGGATSPAVGTFDVREAFAEVRIPIVEEGFFHDLSLEAGFRYSDYGNIATGTQQLQIFAADWTKIGNPIDLGPLGGGGVPTSVVAQLTGSGVVAIRLDYLPLQTSKIIGQRYAADGTLVGPEFEIAAAPGIVNQIPDVSALPGGGFVVAWAEAISLDTDRLFAQRFDALGNAIGARIVVKDFPNNSFATNIDVTITYKGFQVSWVEHTAGGATALQSRPFYDSGQAVDTFFTLDESATGTILFGPRGVTQLSNERIVFGYSMPASGANGPYDALFRSVDITTDYVPILGTAGNDTLDQNLSGRLELKGLGGNDTLIGRGESDILNGGQGDDQLFGRGGGDIMLGGDGNDGGVIDSTFDLFDGGLGIDSAVVQGNFSNFLVDIVDTEVLIAASGSDTRFGDTANNFYDYGLKVANSAIGLGGTLTVIGTELRPGEDLSFDSTDVVTGNLRLFAGAGSTMVHFGAGSDGAFFGVNGNPLTLMVNGGAGADSVAFRGNYSFTLPAGSLDNVEVMVFLTGLANPFGGFIVPGGFDFNVSLANNSFAGVSRLDVVGSSLGIGETMVFNASAVTNGSVRVFGGADRDDITGTANDDLLAGQGGGDRHDGGLGNDLYVLRALSESTLADPDLYIWGAGDADRVDLSFIDADSITAGNQAFTFIGAQAFSGIAGQFRLTLISGIWVGEGDVNGDSAPDFRFGIQAPEANPPIVDDFVL